MTDMSLKRGLLLLIRSSVNKLASNTPSSTRMDQKSADVPCDGAPPSKRVKLASDPTNLISTKGMNGKKLNRRVKPVTSAVEHSHASNHKIFPFMKLPIELQRMILEKALIDREPIQPLDKDVSTGQKKQRLKYNLVPRKRHRNELNLGLAVLRTCKHLHDLGHPILFQNTIDFSETEIGALTIRKFRRSIGIGARFLVRHVSIGSRTVHLRSPTPREQADPHHKDKLKKKVKDINKESDKVFEFRLLIGECLEDIAKNFPRLRTLQLRFNEHEWTPTEAMFDGFLGKEFQTLEVVTKSVGDAEDMVVTSYDSSGVERELVFARTERIRGEKKLHAL